ncbi:MAG: hypothetical protein ACRDPY_31445 [Streptosporangiaceae bacterium]
MEAAQGHAYPPRTKVEETVLDLTQIGCLPPKTAEVPGEGPAGLSTEWGTARPPRRLMRRASR